MVTKDKAAKTRRVEIPRLVRHAKYGKILRRKTVCHVHDENNESHDGDTVEIAESPAAFQVKRWELVRSSQEHKRLTSPRCARPAKIEEEAGVK